MYFLEEMIESEIKMLEWCKEKNKSFAEYFDFDKRIADGEPDEVADTCCEIEDGVDGIVNHSFLCTYSKAVLDDLKKNANWYCAEECNAPIHENEDEPPYRACNGCRQETVKNNNNFCDHCICCRKMEERKKVYCIHNYDKNFGEDGEPFRFLTHKLKRRF